MRTFLIIAIFLITGISYSQEKTNVENIEGIYIVSWEHSNFMELDLDNCLLVADHWTVFAPNVTYKGEPFDFKQIENNKEVYMKVNAEMYTGKSFGHLGEWKSEIIITEILEIDYNRNFDDYLKKCGKIKIKRKIKATANSR